MDFKRIIKKIVIGRSPGSNTVDNLGGTGEMHCDNNDVLESTYYEETYNLSCGCFGQPGGRCWQCGAISCTDCHQHCGGLNNPTSLGCGKPICREHSHHILLDNANLPFCSQCRDIIKRRLRRQKITSLFLNPFIEREVDNDR